MISHDTGNVEETIVDNIQRFSHSCKIHFSIHHLVVSILHDVIVQCPQLVENFIPCLHTTQM